MTNKQRITLVSFLAYFVMSAMLAPIGVISGPMSELFDRSITDVTAQFSWLTFGNLTGACLALVLLDLVGIKLLMILVYGSILASLLVLNFTSDLVGIGYALGIVGVGCGLGLAAAALVISRTYDAERRASMLVITDACFSTAGFVCAALATFFVARAFHWSAAYQFVALVAAVIIMLTAVSRFPSTTSISPETTISERWPLSVWFCLAALFLYTLGQYSILWWLPNYAETQLGATPEQAGSLVTLFWMGLFVTQVFVAWWVMRLGVRRLVVVSGVTTSLFSIPLWAWGDIGLLPVFAFAWGVANLSMLKVVLSFATQMLRLPTPRLVSSLLLGATLGTAISPWLTSRIVVATDNHVVLQFGTACYVVLAAFLILANRLFRLQPATDTVSTAYK